MQHAHTRPPTPKQVDFARHIAARLGATIPSDKINDRASLSSWISEHQSQLKTRTRGGHATSRQVEFAERIARAKRRAIPDECFRDAGMMSAWISSNH